MYPLAKAPPPSAPELPPVWNPTGKFGPKVSLSLEPKTVNGSYVKL